MSRGGAFDANTALTAGGEVFFFLGWRGGGDGGEREQDTEGWGGLWRSDGSLWVEAMLPSLH